jgi:hypothetical protein
MKLDTNQNCSIGALPSELGPGVKDAVERTCDGCGTSLYFSSYLLGRAEVESKSMGLRLFKVCQSCAGPWLQKVAMGDIALESPREHLPKLVPEILRRRREFFRSN